ncbi:MAG TPA: phosphate ABC transporter substrate-binding protein PstS [Terriglobales bacterium]|nr:phosphate ABC transporter substrate-binding protein PstS [Terriglobales bacterium]
MKRLRRRRILRYIGLLSLITLGRGAPAQNVMVLVGAGSSVPTPLYNRWAEEYNKHNSSLQMRYLTVGTSEGIKQISHGAGDFAAGEAQLTEAERREGRLIELPVMIIAIVPVYNLPGVHQELRLSGEVLAEIFLGDVKRWNAPQIAKINPDIDLPNLAIQVVNRPAGKGTNYVFTDFLSKSSSKFRAQIGVSTSPKWPVGTSAERSSDMVDKVKSSPGAIGFVEYQYAVKNNISQAVVLNRAGKYMHSSAESLNAACRAAEAPHWRDFSASLINTAGEDSFPITSFSWIYLRSSSSDASHVAALRDLLDWIYTDGQQFAVREGYASLPPPLVATLRQKIRSLH